jgi:hypothetical protein
MVESSPADLSRLQDADGLAIPQPFHIHDAGAAVVVRNSPLLRRIIDCTTVASFDGFCTAARLLHVFASDESMMTRLVATIGTKELVGAALLALRRGAASSAVESFGGLALDAAYAAESDILACLARLSTLHALAAALVDSADGLATIQQRLCYTHTSSALFAIETIANVASHAALVPSLLQQPLLLSNVYSLARDGPPQSAATASLALARLGAVEEATSSVLCLPNSVEQLLLLAGSQQPQVASTVMHALMKMLSGPARQTVIQNSSLLDKVVLAMTKRSDAVATQRSALSTVLALISDEEGCLVFTALENALASLPPLLQSTDLDIVESAARVVSRLSGCSATLRCALSFGPSLWAAAPSVDHPGRP